MIKKLTIFVVSFIALSFMVILEDTSASESNHANIEQQEDQQ